MTVPPETRTEEAAQVEQVGGLRGFLLHTGPWWLLPTLLGLGVTLAFVLLGGFTPVVKSWYSVF